MSLSLSNYGPNPNRQYAFSSGIQMWSSYTLGDSDTITSSCSGNQEDWRRQPSVTSPRTWSARRGVITGSIEYWALSGSNLKGFQQKGQRESLPERRLGLSYQATHSHDTQGQRQVSTKIGNAFCSRDSLLKWRLTPCKSKGRLAHDADQ